MRRFSTPGCGRRLFKILLGAILLLIGVAYLGPFIIVVLLVLAGLYAMASEERSARRRRRRRAWRRIIVYSSKEGAPVAVIHIPDEDEDSG